MKISIIIDGLETGYFAQENGEIINKHGKTMTPVKQKSGYMNVKLSFNKKTKTCYVHRLIAEAFLENPENKEIVNHINGKKFDNRSKNLEWNTPSENTKHYYKSLPPEDELGKDFLEACRRGDRLYEKEQMKLQLID